MVLRSIIYSLELWLYGNTDQSEEKEMIYFYADIPLKTFRPVIPRPYILFVQSGYILIEAYNIKYSTKFEINLQLDARVAYFFFNINIIIFHIKSKITY